MNVTRRSVLSLLSIGWLGCRAQSSQGAMDALAEQATGDGGEASTSEQERYVSLGDSFTAGTGASAEQSFPARLVARWVARGRRVSLENPAVNGYTTGDVIARELSVIERVRPTLVTLAIGANNIVRGGSDEAYRADVQRILRAARGARLVCVGQPEWPRSPTGRMFGEVSATLNRVRVFNGILREECESAGGQWAELSALMTAQADRAMWALDGLHPSAEAYDQWAEALDRVIGGG